MHGNILEKRMDTGKETCGGQVTDVIFISVEGPPLVLFRHFQVCVLVRA